MAAKWNVLACAIEDNRVVYLDAVIARHGDCTVVESTGELTDDPRADFIVGNIKDDQHDFDMQVFAKRIAAKAASLKKPVHFIAISTFGTVNVASGNVEFYPHDPDVIARRGDRVSECLPNLVKSALIKRDGLNGVIVDNDATAAALGEFAFGVGKNMGEFAYVWAGRGINAGLVLHGESWKGRLHPEAGHILVRRHESEPDERGSCANHRGCITGLAALSRIYERMHARELAEPDAKLKKLIAYYYAQLCVSITLIAAPARIAIGGVLLDVLPGFVNNVRSEFRRLIGSYPRYPQQLHEEFIQESLCSQTAAVLGMIEMTRQRIERT